jgi:hypothetical protein
MKIKTEHASRAMRGILQQQMNVIRGRLRMLDKIMYLFDTVLCAGC